ncbi:hypothetical protein FGG08_004200 [Glutinoglossum americanum]|uniref:Glycosyl transferase CAP10 domain-containing protein n=1 Tax=Glutinoglossum americanum TaxID=1670608 RepID=A0A9P8I692_9PEZI|nr:hypothetical protein FGG08_004200 [Glutinoglossum americanum]
MLSLLPRFFLLPVPPLTFSLFACTTITALLKPSAHELLISAVSWTLIWVYAVLRCGNGYTDERERGGDGLARRLSWTAGGFLLLGSICEKAAGGGAASRWTKAATSNRETPTRSESKYLIVITSWVSFLVLAQPFVTFPGVVLGLCNIVLTTLAYSLLEQVPLNAGDGDSEATPATVSANGSISRLRRSTSNVSNQASNASLRDVAATLAVGSSVAAFLFEPLRMDARSFYRVILYEAGPDWKTAYQRFDLAALLISSLVGCLRGVLVLEMIRKRGAIGVAFVDTGGALCASLTVAMSALKVFLTLLWASTTYIFIRDSHRAGEHSTYGYSFSPRGKILGRLLFCLAIVIIIKLTTLYLQQHQPVNPRSESQLPTAIPPNSSSTHPITKLLNDAEVEFKQVRSKQSKSLSEAVAEYRNRYKTPPPPYFDKWYEFARSRNVQLIDEYDTIYHSLMPFWALEPATIRARARESLGFDNAFIPMLIRDGQVVKIEGGSEWQQQATLGMVKDFVQFLPDMDIALNIHDEPRVVIPQGDLAKLVTIAKDKTMPAAFANAKPRNSFSSRPKDVNDGRRIVEFKTTRFVRSAHQPTWPHSRQSCSLESPARGVGDDTPDDYSVYALGELGFVANQTAFSDICNSPSLRETFGFFDRPNAFNIAQELFPVFSQSKISSFQDILYPSPWYWFDKVPYDESMDMDWSLKANKMYWRGSTTGGFSRNGGWRRQHRQRLVRRINANDNANILVNSTTEWKPKEVKRADYNGLFDVHFSHIGQCDPADCDEQREFFTIADPAGQQDAWASRHLLDIDGNAFSGRFYAFLKSKSLVFKMSVFREWHMEWLRPWVHYIPLSLKGDEWLEAMRHFANDEDGMANGMKVAMAGREWAGKVLRNEDLEVWFFRLLLE